jgi:hypothetical protein
VRTIHCVLGKKRRMRMWWFGPITRIDRICEPGLNLSSYNPPQPLYCTGGMTRGSVMCVVLGVWWRREEPERSG